MEESLATLAGKRVLLAEDNEVNREIALVLLQRMGLKVDAVADGRQFLDRAAETRFDLALLDLQMPQLDGLAAARAVRRLDGWSDVPIIAFTANGFAEEKEACRAAGMNDFLVKPIDPETLRLSLAHWLSRTR